MKYIIKESQIGRLIESQEYLNFLLDKINQNGYESLNDREKDALVRISKGEEVYDEPEELPVSDDVYRPDDIFIKYAGKYNELEVDDQLFRIELMGGTDFLEILGDYLNFMIKPDLENGQILIEDGETDEIDSIKFKNVPETTEGMRKLAVKFIYQILPQYIRQKMG